MTLFQTCESREAKEAKMIQCLEVALYQFNESRPKEKGRKVSQKNRVCSHFSYLRLSFTLPIRTFWVIKGKGPDYISIKQCFVSQYTTPTNDNKQIKKCRFLKKAIEYRKCNYVCNEKYRKEFSFYVKQLTKSWYVVKNISGHQTLPFR